MVNIDELKQAYNLISKSLDAAFVPHWTPWTQSEPEYPIPIGSVIRRQVLTLTPGAMDIKLAATIKWDGTCLCASVNLGPHIAHPFARFAPDAWDEAKRFVDGQLSLQGHILL